MRLPFCDYHISEILEKETLTEKPLDLILSNYFKTHKSLGASDRRVIGETLYQMVRYKTLIDFFCSSKKGIDRLYAFRKISIAECQKNPSIPEPTKLGLSFFLFEKFCSAFGKEKAQKLAQILNQSAPTTIRVNSIKTTVEELLKAWEGKFQMKRCLRAKNGLQFQKREALFSLDEFKKGFFEVQDEGSQLVAELVEVKSGEHVLDYCSGSGGKALAFAPQMSGKGQIYLYDNRPWILQEARKRMRRAGVQNVQFVLPKRQVDWLLTDVPCSGTGTLRRNPDAKWKIDENMVQRLVQEQREIVKTSLNFLKTGGRLVYATCSLLPEENEHQVEHFLKTLPLELEKQMTFFPEENGQDGFFAAVFKKRDLLSSHPL
jgi:16S rRNA C967 or C1407 C5-methylase (RsmB/RsmF family)